MTKDSKESFGLQTPIGRAGQPIEIATSFVFLSSADSSYMSFVLHCPSYPVDNFFDSFDYCCSGQVLHPNGGTVIA